MSDSSTLSFRIRSDRKATFAAVFFLILSSILLPGTVLAQTTFEWINTTNSSNFFDTVTNWNPTGQPGSNDLAQFNQDATYNVLWDNITGNLTVNELAVQAGHVRFDKLVSNSLTLTVNNSFLVSGADTTLSVEKLSIVSGATSVTGGAVLDFRFDAGGLNHASSSLSVHGSSVSFQDGARGLLTEGVEVGAGLVNGQTANGQLRVTGANSVLQTNQVQLLGGDMVVENGGRLIGLFAVSPIEQLLMANGSSLKLSGSLNQIEISGLVSVSGGSTITLEDGATLGADNVFLFEGSANVDGAGSHLDHTATFSPTLYIGRSSDEDLVVTNGGLVSATDSLIGADSGISGTATVDSSQWNNSGSLIVGVDGNGTLNVDAGGVVSSTFGSVARELNSTGTVNVTDGSQWINNGALEIGRNGHGTLTVSDNSFVVSTSGAIGVGANSHSSASIDGSNSGWAMNGPLTIGKSGIGSLSIASSGQVLSQQETILGEKAGSSGTVSISNSGSMDVEGLLLGINGNSELSISSMGVVNSISARAAIGFGSNSAINLSGFLSRWDNTQDLDLGVGGSATLNIVDNASVTIGGTTTIGGASQVNLNRGQFNFGSTTMNDLTRVNATIGTLTGNVVHNGFTDVGNVSAFQSGAVDVTGVTITNSGVMFGGATMGRLVNQTSGEIETIAGERMRFTGTGNINNGEINNFGGQIRFNQDVSNSSSGFVSGRGQFIANGGWDNQGVMAFSSGITDVLGDVSNSGSIVTSGLGTTNFFDDVVHNGTEIRTASGSSTAFFGSLSGSGAFTGTGTVFFEGDLRPGNSPDVVSFDGDVDFGQDLNSLFELGGLAIGEFDQLDIEGSLFLDGLLTVELINGFHLGYNQQFLIADVDGGLFGTFAGFSEGDLVGNFGGQNLFITYNGFGGNSGVGLFTAVPEPGSLAVVGMIAVGMGMRRRRGVA